MTISAWIMLSLTWTVVAFFAARFFVLVMRTPGRRDAPHVHDTEGGTTMGGHRRGTPPG